MAVSAYALSTRAELKSHLGITATTDDTILDGYIDQSTAMIERLIGRQIMSRAYSEWYGLNGTGRLKLKQFPANIVAGVWTGSADAFSVVASTSSDLRVTISISTESLGTGAPAVILNRTVLAGATTTTTLLLSTYTDVADLVVAIDATAGFDATLIQDMRTAQLHPRAGGDCLTTTATLSGADISSEYVFDSQSGIISLRGDMLDMYDIARFPFLPQSVLVDYSAGYSAVPADLHYACMVVSAQMYLSRRADTSVASESLGDYSYTRASAETARATLMHLVGDWREIR